MAARFPELLESDLACLLDQKTTRIQRRQRRQVAFMFCMFMYNLQSTEQNKLFNSIPNAVHTQQGSARFSLPEKNCEKQNKFSDGMTK